jgi:hypothetical protein
MKRGAPRKIFTKADLLRSMRYTKSIKAASRYLGCSYQHVKPYFKMFRLDDADPNSPTLFEVHKNQQGVGIPKFLPNRRREPNVKRIFKEGIGYESFTAVKIKSRGIAEGYLKDECYKCGCNERRITDYKTPTLLNFIDGNKINYLVENLEILCYNCYFLYVADPLTLDDLRHIESNQTVKANPFAWEVEEIRTDDQEYIDNMKALGLI